jgi:hypothetical protein
VRITARRKLACHNTRGTTCVCVCEHVCVREKALCARKREPVWRGLQDASEALSLSPTLVKRVRATGEAGESDRLTYHISDCLQDNELSVISERAFSWEVYSLYVFSTPFLVGVE